MSARRAAAIAALTASAIGLRLLKHAAVGPLPLVNAPAAFTIVASSLFGLVTGSSVGFLSLFISDLLLGFGPWTVINSALMAAVGALAALTVRWPCGTARLFATSAVLLFAYDVASSVAFYTVLFGLDLYRAAIVAVVGLFVPAGGGFLYAVGPIQELTTAFLISATLPLAAKALRGYI